MAILKNLAPSAAFVVLASFASLAAGCHDDRAGDPRYYDHGQKAHPASESAGDQAHAGDSRPAVERPEPFTPVEYIAAYSGEIAVRVRTSEGAWVSASVEATYASTDSESGKSFAASSMIAPPAGGGELAVPLGWLSRDRLFALDSFRVLARGQVLRAYSGTELESLRLRSRKGVAVNLTLDSKQPQVAAEAVTRDALPPLAGASEQEYVPLGSAFPSPEGILAAPDTQETLDRLRALASATSRYHLDLLELVERAPSIDATHLAMVLQAMYFDARATERLARMGAALAARRDRFASLLREPVERNLKFADSMSSIGNRILAQGLDKAPALTETEAFDLLGRSFLGASARPAFEGYLKRFKPETAEARVGFMRMAKSKRQFWAVSRVGGSWFANDSDGSVAALFELLQGVPEGEEVDALIAAALPRIATLSKADAIRLLKLLRTQDGVIYSAPALVSRVPGLEAGTYLDLIDAIPMGARRDQALLDSLSSVEAFTAAQACDVLRAAYLTETRRALARELFALIPGLKVEDIMDLAAVASRGGLRDDVLMDGIAALGESGSKPLSATRLIDLMAQATSARGQLAVLEAGMHRVSDLTVENAIALARVIGVSNPRDTALLKLVDAVTGLTRANLPQLAELGSTESVRKELRRRGALRLDPPAPGRGRPRP